MSKRELQRVTIPSFTTWKGVALTDFPLSYEVAGPALGTAPVVLVCHALTGNSHVAAPDGWWAKLIGEGQAIDTSTYTILTFNIPGNAYDGVELEEADTFSLKNVAEIFLLGLKQLRVSGLKAVIGASMGGALAWQIAALEPELAELVIPIACDYRASDWLLAQTEVQQLILKNSPHPLHDARIHAMLCYRTPKSLCERFQNEEASEQVPKVLDWLRYHGRTLEERFSLAAYRTMTFLTENIRVADNVRGLVHIRGVVHLVSIDSDLLFPHEKTIQTARELQELGVKAHHHTIHSIHGHDAFLMEYTQLSEIIAPLFQTKTA